MNEKLQKILDEEVIAQLKSVASMTVGDQYQVREIQNIKTLADIQRSYQEHDLNMRIKAAEEARKERAEAREIEMHQAKLKAMQAETELKQKEYQLKVDEAEKQDYRDGRDFAYKKERDEVHDEHQRQQEAYQAKHDHTEFLINAGGDIGNGLITIGIAIAAFLLELNGPFTMASSKNGLNFMKRLK